MDRTEVLREVRKLRFADWYEGWRARRVTQREARRRRGGGEQARMAAGVLVEELLRPLGLADKIRAANRAAAKGDGEMPEGVMLEVEDRVTAWRRKLLEEGRAEGVKEGERRGRAQGEQEGERRGRAAGMKEGRTAGVKEARAEQAAMLLRFAEWKFGPEAAEGLAGVATPDEGPNGLSLTRLRDWIIDCDTMEELLERLENGFA